MLHLVIFFTIYTIFFYLKKHGLMNRWCDAEGNGMMQNFNDKFLLFLKEHF